MKKKNTISYEAGLRCFSFVMVILGGFHANAKLSAATDSSMNRFRFIDEISSDSERDMFKRSGINPDSLKPWKEEEKRIVLESTSNLQKNLPGLMDRAWHDQTVKLIRTTQAEGSEFTLATAFYDLTAIRFCDSSFDSNVNLSLTEILAHEIAHLVQFITETDRRKSQWATLAQPKIDEVRKALQKAGKELPYNRKVSKEEYFELTRQFGPVARAAGLPRLYGAKNLRESFAVCFELYASGEEPSPEFDSFIREHYLTVPYVPAPGVRECNRAVSLARMRKTSEAIDSLDKAIQDNPDLRQAYYQRGLLYYQKLRNYNQAITDFSKAIDLYSDTPDILIGSHKNRAACWLGLEKGREALADYDAIIELQPDEPMHYLLRARAWEALDKPDEVIGDLTSALDLKPDYIDAMEDRGLAFNRMGNFTSAENDFLRAIGVSDEDPREDSRFFEMNGRMHLTGTTDYRAAVDALTKSIEIAESCQKEGTEWTYSLRASALAKLGKYEEALKDCEESLYRVSRWDLHMRMAMGRDGKGLDLLKLRLIPALHHSIPTLLARGVSRIHLGDYEKGIADLLYAENFAYYGPGSYASKIETRDDRSIRDEIMREAAQWLRHAEKEVGEERFNGQIAGLYEGLKIDWREYADVATRTRQAGMEDDANIFIDSLTSRLPNRWEGYAARARYRTNKEDYDEALSDWEKVLERNDEDQVKAIVSEGRGEIGRNR